MLGLDPDPLRLWPGAGERAGAASLRELAPAARAARAVAAHCRLVIDALSDQCAAVKPQLARFECLGAPGWDALAQTVDYAHAAGLLVIADAKRGDIDVSARAYAQAFLGQTPTPYGPLPGLGVDALTVNPWLGADALAPLLDAARTAPRPAGLFVLVRTSNPGAAELQDLELAGGGSVSLAAARLVERLGAGRGGSGGLSDVGAVIGATAPTRIAALRAAMPHAIFLIPGVGAQGGRVESLGPAFGRGRASVLVSLSRSLVDAYRADGGEPAASARRVATRLRAALERLP